MSGAASNSVDRTTLRPIEVGEYLQLINYDPRIEGEDLLVRVVEVIPTGRYIVATGQCILAGAYFAGEFIRSPDVLEDEEFELLEVGKAPELKFNRALRKQRAAMKAILRAREHGGKLKDILNKQ